MKTEAIQALIAMEYHETANADDRDRAESELTALTRYANFGLSLTTHFATNDPCEIYKRITGFETRIAELERTVNGILSPSYSANLSEMTIEEIELYIRVILYSTQRTDGATLMIAMGAYRAKFTDRIADLEACINALELGLEYDGYGWQCPFCPFVLPQTRDKRDDAEAKRLHEEQRPNCPAVVARKLVEVTL